MPDLESYVATLKQEQAGNWPTENSEHSDIGLLFAVQGQAGSLFLRCRCVVSE